MVSDLLNMKVFSKKEEKKSQKYDMTSFFFKPDTCFRTVWFFPWKPLCNVAFSLTGNKTFISITQLIKDSSSDNVSLLKSLERGRLFLYGLWGRGRIFLGKLYMIWNISPTTSDFQKHICISLIHMFKLCIFCLKKLFRDVIC